MNNNKVTTTTRWGIIGCGAVTEFKSGPAYQKTPGFALCSVMRRDLALAKSYATRHGVPNFTCHAADIINSQDIDAVYIATPPDSHKHYALQVAQAGKTCCIEKPLSPSYRDSLAIFQAFDQAKLPLFVAYYRRSLPRFNHIKALLQQKAIGQLRHINWHLSKRPSQTDMIRANNWRTDKSVAPGGYFDDLASHGLDLFAHLLGEFEQVKGIANNQQGLYSSFDAIAACWQHRSGVTGAGSWNFASYAREDKVTIYGSEGEISFSVFDETPVQLLNADGQQDIVIEHPENIQLYHVQNMREQLEGGAAHPSNGASALHTSWVMQQILASDG